MMAQGLVIVFALLAAVCMAIGIVVRQRATMDVPIDQGVSPTMVTTLLRTRLWWIGTGVAVAGYVCQALALTTAQFRNIFGAKIGDLQGGQCLLDLLEIGVDKLPAAGLLAR